MPLVHPYGDLTGGTWLRGNLHAHSTQSDGARPVQQVFDAYAARGYDFFMLSDHDVFSSPEFLARHDRRGMVLLAGNEITANGPHLLHVGATAKVEPHPNRQAVFDEINRKGGGFAVVNHPNWLRDFNHCPQAFLEEWQGYTGLEIFNGVICRLDGSEYALDRWDMLLSAGRRVWGFANDDSHAMVGDDALGWNMVYSRTRSSDAIVDAMRQGRFYASTGVVISDIAVNGMSVRITAPNADRIVAVRDFGRRIATVDATTLEVEVPVGTKYVRFECYGRAEQQAWTQPFFVATE